MSHEPWESREAEPRRPSFLAMIGIAFVALISELFWRRKKP